MTATLLEFSDRFGPVHVAKVDVDGTVVEIRTAKSREDFEAAIAAHNEGKPVA